MSELPSKKVKTMKAGPAADLFSNNENELDPLVSRLHHGRHEAASMHESNSSINVLRNDVLASNGRHSDNISSNQLIMKHPTAAAKMPGRIPVSFDDNMRGAADSSVHIPEQSSLHEHNEDEYFTFKHQDDGTGLHPKVKRDRNDENGNHLES